MTSFAAGHSRADSRAQKPDSHEAIPYFLGGVVLGAVAAVASAIVDGGIIAAANKFSGNEMCGAGFSTAVIALIGVAAVVVSIGMGIWLFRLRRWIGTKADPDDLQWVRTIRRHFTIGAFLAYLPLTPCIWLLALAAANCAG